MVGIIAAVTLALGACASAPVTPSAPVIPEAVPIRMPPVAAPEAATAPAAAPVELSADETALPKVAHGEQYSDLLERMRAGFALGDFDEDKIDREAEWFARHPDYIERTFTRAAPHLHYIVGEVEARGLPLELAVLPVIESAFEPYAYSRARAAGLWQFIPGTGTRFGLKQDWWYDGRRDIVSATRAALDYLEFLNAQFNGDWLLAIAAYNCGELAVERAVRINQAAGRPIDFWHLKLPAETRAYVPKLLAMARIVANPAEYGLEFSQIPNEPYFTRVETGGQIDLNVAAELAGMSTEDLYSLNPAYHRFATDPTGPHFLLVPVDVADTFRQNLLQLTEDQRMRVERYSVRRSDTVASIAKHFGTTPALIRELNGLEANSRIEINSELRVPSSITTLPPKVLRAAALVDGRSSLRRGRGRHLHVVHRGDSLYGIARKTGIDVKTLAQLNGMSPNDKLRAGQRLNLGTQSAAEDPSDSGGKKGGRSAASRERRVTYVVRRGDTLSRIARVLQVSVASLLTWNDLPSTDAIRVGQKLVAYVRHGS